jgi:hypothetical protein
MKGISMQFGCLKCDPISIPEVIASPDFDNQNIAVHGIIYYGEGCEKDEYLVLPKEGPFDGVWPIAVPESLDRSKCLLIEEPNLFNKLGGSSACGAWLFKEDAILVGQIRRQPGSNPQVRICNLWLILMQNWADEGMGWTNHNLRVIIFPQSALPPLPWMGFQGKRNAYPVLRVYPQPNDTP